MSDAQVEQWGIFEARFTGSSDGNPFLGVTFSAQFRQSDRQFDVKGFYDGDGIYVIRFMPNALGRWEYTTRSSEDTLTGLTGSFDCVAPAPGKHGPVYVKNQFHFAYADGTPYYPFGTTCYAWAHQGELLETQTLSTLKEASFNKLRMCVFPKHYAWNQNEPPLYPFERDAAGNHDFTRFNPAFFQHFEQRIGDLRDLGIEADLIIFHPYDRWGYARMDAETDYRYLSYLAARLSAYHNVWWSLANEYDFMLEYKPMERWDRFFEILLTEDPYNHLRSIHQGNPQHMYDHTKLGVTHVCIQHPHVRQVVEWRKQYGKPIIDDELEYEGNIFYPWGGISAEEEVHRFWLIVVNGGYAGHGETYVHPDDVLWWSKGGILHGESWKRIAFLRQIIEAAPPGGLTSALGVETGLFPFPTGMGNWLWNRFAGGFNGDYHLLYTAEYQPCTLLLWLPFDKAYQFDLIDTWEMTITPAVVHKLDSLPSYLPNDTYPTDSQPTYEVEMPGKIHMALRIAPR